MTHTPSGGTVEVSSDPRSALARRLKSLRQEFASGGVTQSQLAQAIGVSEPSISSWESAISPKVPPRARLSAYARLFATTRSIDKGRVRMIDDAALTPTEQARRDELERELQTLRSRALSADTGERVEEAESSGPLHFPDRQQITIVCAPLPAPLLAHNPYAKPTSPDYTELYTYSDPDALVELYGRVCALNPGNDVRFCLADDLGKDYSTHLVLLGGVDWNKLTRNLLEDLPVPVRQLGREGDESNAAFQVRVDDATREFRPRLRIEGDQRVLLEDVAHIMRAPSPYNARCTVTIFNGMFGRGTYGAVRSLTDPEFRDRNIEYLDNRFQGGEIFSILARVRLMDGQVLTPDWSVPQTRLHEWPEGAA